MHLRSIYPQDLASGWYKRFCIDERVWKSASEDNSHVEILMDCTTILPFLRKVPEKCHFMRHATTQADATGERISAGPCGHLSGLTTGL